MNKITFPLTKISWNCEQDSFQSMEMDNVPWILFHAISTYTIMLGQDHTEFMYKYIQDLSYFGHISLWVLGQIIR